MRRGFADLLVVFHSTPPHVSRGAALPWRSTGERHDAWEVLTGLPEDGGGLAFPGLGECRVGPWHVRLMGELFGYRGGGGARGQEGLLRAYCDDLAAGRASPESLNGHFAVVAWEEEAGEWHVWTDRLGTYHVYHATDGRRAALGTFSPAVAEAASARRLDWTGLSGFFDFGFFPQDRTYYEDVRILRPATHAVYDRDGRPVRQSRYWEWRHRPDESRSYAETVEEFGETLGRILDDQTRRGRVALPLSSGLDSRTVAAVATSGRFAGGGPDSPPAPWCYSYGYTDDSAETSIAARAAAARGLPFERFTIGPYLFDRIDTVISCTEGFQGIASTRQSAVVGEIAAHADYLLAAHWGDVWMDDMGLLDHAGVPDDEAVLDHALHKVRKKGGGWLLDHVARPQLGGRDPEQLLREMVREELGRVASIADPDFRVKAFKTEQWSFRWTLASLRTFLPGAFVRLPFYDDRMVDFCCTLPSRQVKGRRLQIDYLKRFHRDLAWITWDVTDSSLYFRQYYDTWLLPKRAWKKLRRMASGRRHVGRNWEVQFLNERGKSGLHEWLLRPGLKVHDLVSRGAVQALVDEVLARPSAGNGDSLATLLTLSVWLEHYG